MGQGHGWEGAVLKLLRAKDFVFTVTGAEDVTEHYRRVHLTDGGMLAATGVHPTMWVRLWFDNAGKPHQRAYTLVDPDPGAGTFSLEFALHEGVASDWARTAKPGDTIEATIHGTGFTQPEPAPSHVFAIADTPDPYVWIACDTATTRALTSYVRKELGLPKQRVNALGYWRP